MAVDSQVASLIIACIDWLKVEPLRLTDCWETTPTKSGQTQEQFAREMGYETAYSTAQCNNAIAAIKAGNLTACQDAIAKLRGNLGSPIMFAKGSGGEVYAQYVDELMRILHSDLRSERAKRELRALWFELTHSWRSKDAKGVPSIPDRSQFMLIESIVTLVAVWLGIVLPIIRPQTTGIYTAFPIVLFALMCLSNVAAAFSRTSTVREVVFGLSAGIGFIPIIYLLIQLHDAMSHSVLWSWAGGAIVGVLLGNDLALRRSRRMANKYGPLACLWARACKKNTYEFILVRTDGTVAWRYVATGWYKHIDPLLGADLAICYRRAVKNCSYEAQGVGGWFACYPALVATRMIGMRRRNPEHWPEARHSTPDLSEEVIREFFAQAPSPVAPPSGVLEIPAVTLPKKTALPW